MDCERTKLATDKNEDAPKPNLSEIEKQEGGSGKKRPAPETLEHDVTKVAKIAAAGEDKGIVTEQAKQVHDPRDEKIAKLTAKLQKSKDNVAELEDELEEVRDELIEHRCRVNELEARERKRIEKENIVETSMHATMKLAAKNMEAEGRAKLAKKEKELKEKYKLDRDDYAAKHDASWKKKLGEAASKAQKNEKQLQEKLIKANDNHKQEVKALKEEHKEALKDLRPEHSSAMKEKAKELKAKEKEIADLQKSVKEMKVLKAKNEKLEGVVDVQKGKISDFLHDMEKERSQRKTMESQYNSKLEHEGKRWQLQNDNATEANGRLMLLQRTNFALRADRDAKDNRILELKGELEVARDHVQNSNRLMLQQPADSALKGERDEKENKIRVTEGEVQAAQEQSQRLNEKACFQRSIAMNEVSLTAVLGENVEASIPDLSSTTAPVAADGTTNGIVEASAGSGRSE